MSEIVTIQSVQDRSGDALLTLQQFLAEEPEMRGSVTQPAGAEPGQMGDVADTLLAALGSGGALAAFATAMKAWIQSRTSDVTIRLSRSTGSSIEFTCTNSRDAERLLSQFVEEAEDLAD